MESTAKPQPSKHALNIAARAWHRTETISLRRDDVLHQAFAEVIDEMLAEFRQPQSQSQSTNSKNTSTNKIITLSSDLICPNPQTGKCSTH
jgi:hypothetical protein